MWQVEIPPDYLNRRTRHASGPPQPEALAGIRCIGEQVIPQL